jgi:hypothetical protein
LTKPVLPAIVYEIAGHLDRTDWCSGCILDYKSDLSVGLAVVVTEIFDVFLSISRRMQGAHLELTTLAFFLFSPSLTTIIFHDYWKLYNLCS